MEFPIFIFGLISVIVVLFTAQITEANTIPTPLGLLNAMPRNCENKGFCHEKHEQYPQKLIDDLLTEKFDLQLGNYGKPINFTYRDSTGENLDDCANEPNYELIHEIVDKNNDVRVVVQSKRFQQRIRVEKCKYPGQLSADIDQQTTHFSNHELKNYNIFCAERVLHFPFLVLTRDGKNVEVAKSKNGIPVSCYCRLQAN